MPDLLQTGIAWMAGQLNAHASHAVTYSRGGDSVSLLATIGNTEFEHVDEYGVVHKIESRDYLIIAADLVLDESEVLPATGDKVTDGDSVYEVSPMGTDAPYKFVGGHTIQIRIHTKRIN